MTLKESIEALRRQAAEELPEGEARRASNHLNQILVRINRYNRRRAANSITTPREDVESQMTQQQIADRYIAKKAIFEALAKGRHISFLDSAEFKVSEMHTQMHCIRTDIADKQLPYVLKSKWLDCTLAGKRCKEYWLESKENTNNN